MSESGLAVPETGAVDIPGVFDPDLDFRKLALEAAYFTRGFRLVEKAELRGVPHIIIGVTYRPGFTEKSGLQHDYVSVEAVVADAQTLGMPQFKRQLPSELTVFPNEAVVYNDGGTGIRRSLTELFSDVMGIIDVGVSTMQDENQYDRPMSEWISGGELAQAGITADQNGQKFRYVVLRGLRSSEYTNEYGDSETWYFG